MDVRQRLVSGSVEGRLQDASVFGCASLTRMVDGEGTIFGRIKQLSVQ